MGSLRLAVHAHEADAGLDRAIASAFIAPAALPSFGTSASTLADALAASTETDAFAVASARVAARLAQLVEAHRLANTPVVYQETVSARRSSGSVPVFVEKLATPSRQRMAAFVPETFVPETIAFREAPPPHAAVASANDAFSDPIFASNAADEFAVAAFESQKARAITPAFSDPLFAEAPFALTSPSFEYVESPTAEELAALYALGPVSDMEPVAHPAADVLQLRLPQVAAPDDGAATPFAA